MKDRLQLTPEQEEQVRPIFIDELRQLKALRDKYVNDDADQGRRRGRLKMARELKDIQKATDDKLKPILTSPQMDELKKIRQEWRERASERARTAH